MTKPLRLHGCLAALLVLASAPATARADPASAPKAGPLARRLAVSFGFSHWFGRTFGSPDGYTTPMFAVGVRPGVSFLEIKARYARSAGPMALPDGRTSVVSFTTLELLVTRELLSGRQSLAGFFGPVALLTHTGAPEPGVGYGVAIGAEYMLRTGLRGDHALGIFFAAHEVFYALPGDRTNLLEDPRRDAQIDLGLISTLF